MFVYPNYQALIFSYIYFQHNIKKIRNNLFASGDRSYHKRHLVFPQIGTSADVKWSYWVDAYQWDIVTHSFPVHRKLSEQHLFPTIKERMRNHLAEEVLDEEMLHLMMVSKSKLNSYLLYIYYNIATIIYYVIGLQATSWRQRGSSCGSYPAAQANINHGCSVQ